MRSNRGFTLVEMMVAITVLGIALAFGLPAIRGSMDRAEVDRVESELQSDLRLALSTAKSSRRALRLTFTNDGYRLVDAADSTRVFRSRQFATTVRLTASTNPVVFPWGVVQPTELQIAGIHDSSDLLILPTGRIEDAVD